MASLRPPLTLALGLLLASCSSEVGGTTMAIGDPLGLIDQVQGPLRLFVMPADSYTCDDTTGKLSPDVPDAPQGMVMDAVADITVPIMTSSAQGQVKVHSGSYTVLVRGKGTDPVSGRQNVFIATGCTSVMIKNGHTTSITINLLPIVGMGQCGDGVLSPDEQCEDGNTMSGDGCSSTCRTEPFVVNTTTAGVQNHPAVGGAPDQRWLVTCDSGNSTTLLRVLEADGSAVTQPAALTSDADIHTAVSNVSGAQLLSAAAVAKSGRMGMAWTDFAPTTGGVRVAFFSKDRAAEGPSILVGPGMATNAAVAFAGDGTFMVVFEDPGSSTGLSGQIFPAASAMPIGTNPFEVGTGATGAAGAAVAGASDHFVTAFSAGGDVYVQRFGADGTPTDASAVAVLMSAPGTQDQATVAALSDGRALVAWRDDGPDGDGAGKSIRARAFGADGTPAGDAMVLNSTTAGDQEEPAAVGSGDTFAVAFTSAGSVRARFTADTGDPAPNRDKPPTTADFEVAPMGADVAASAGGGSVPGHWMVVWDDGNDIHGRLFPIP